MNHAAIERAAASIAEADGLLFTAGAGMGVDSGLPDFRGNEGFWRAYPPLAQAGLSFADLANPALFRDDPDLAWGFYGHRLSLYRSINPHVGFDMVRKWAQDKAAGGFAWTSNVDGHFQKSGWDEDGIVECHGSIHFLQCSVPCHEELWPAGELNLEIDEDFRAREIIPRCARCGAIARPNILMFYDGQWLWTRLEEQDRRFRQWLENLAGKSLVIVECGAGTAIPTVRHTGEHLAEAGGATLIRINPREPQGPDGTIFLPLNALEALSRLNDQLQT